MSFYMNPRSSMAAFFKCSHFFVVPYTGRVVYWDGGVRTKVPATKLPHLGARESLVLTTGLSKKDKPIGFSKEFQDCYLPDIPVIMSIDPGINKDLFGDPSTYKVTYLYSGKFVQSHYYDLHNTTYLDIADSLRTLENANLSTPGKYLKASFSSVLKNIAQFPNGRALVFKNPDKFVGGVLFNSGFLDLSQRKAVTALKKAVT